MEAFHVVLPVTAAVPQCHSVCHPVLQPAMAGSCQQSSLNAAQAACLWTGGMLLPPLSCRPTMLSSTVPGCHARTGP